jgi:hypothetical protein
MRLESVYCAPQACLARLENRMLKRPTTRCWVYLNEVDRPLLEFCEDAGALQIQLEAIALRFGTGIAIGLEPTFLIGLPREFADSTAERPFSSRFWELVRG